jgi:hypothetical protein
MVQIAFLTLFLGLTAGQQPVALEVQGPVTAVELVLDGTAVGRMAGPPWRTNLDFGTGLEPHELIARALDDKGQEVGRARQILNLPRPAAEVEIVVENGPKGPAGARLTWRSLTGEKPAAASLFLDGQPLQLDAEARAALPRVDAETPHILSAEVRFSGLVVARKDISFGGPSGEVSTNLTAVPVRLKPGKTLPAAASLQGWILTDGKPVPVTAVEEGMPQLLVVRDNEARPFLEVHDREPGNGTALAAVVSQGRRSRMTLGKDGRIRFVWPAAQSFAGQDVPSELFDASRDYTSKDGGLLWLLGRALPQTDKAEQRLADATAVAGLQALAGNRPRAVLLVLGKNARDASRYSAATVRHYLESVRVPLIAWALDSSSPAASAWGGAADISTLPHLEAAFKRLDNELAAQRILWIDGSYLPGAISLSPAAAEVLEMVR